MRSFFTAIAACAIISLSVQSARASVLAGFLVNGVNTLEDGSREIFLDLANPDGDATVEIDPDDALIGFSKMTGIEPYDSLHDPVLGPIFGPDATPNSVYAIFTQTFRTMSADLVPGPITLRTFDFKPSTGFISLSSLLGTLDDDAIAGGADLSMGAVAIVSANSGAFSIDLSNTSPGDRDGDLDVDFEDYLDVLRDEGNLDIVFQLDLANGDFFDGTTDVTGAPPLPDFVADLSTAPAGRNLVTFGASLSVAYSEAQIVVTSDGLVLGGNARLPSAAENPDGIFTFVDDADIVFGAIITPEPASMTVWALLSIGGMGVAYARRKLNRR